MLASAAFGIERTKKDDWFDTILDVDTELFVDPFLIFKETAKPWADSHNRIIQHFNRAFILVAEANGNPNALAYKKAMGLLEFREPGELALGYTAKGTRGSGSGKILARLMVKAIAAAINRGLDHPKHFEELGILEEGIGADRISDAACTILKPLLVQYTQSIAARHKIPLAPHRIYAATFDENRKRFLKSEVHVPTNPASQGPLLFVPQRFLDDLPRLNAEDWWESYENERLRTDLNYEVMGKVDKATIVRTARENRDFVRSWTESRSDDDPSPYDFKKDPKGVIQWETASRDFTAANPLVLQPPSSERQFDAVIEQIIERFRLFIEEQRGWFLLWDGAKEKPELAPQLVFYGIARNYCEANNVVVDPETDLGRGPVDFKFSNGYEHRAHLEVKKLHNGKFWKGLDQQLPAYLSSDAVKKGWFLAVRYRDGKQWDKRQAELPGRVRQAGKTHKLNLRSALVDARRPPSASKL